MIFENGERKCGTFPVELTPDVATQARLAADYSGQLAANSDFLQMFEFWDPIASGGACAIPDSLSATLADFIVNGSNRPEVSHSTGINEVHCVRPGRYTFTIDGGGVYRSMPIDYIQPSGYTATHNVTGEGEAIETTAYDPASTNYMDLVVHVDVTTTHLGDSPVLDVQNAGSNPYSGTFSNDASPTGTPADWFRFSVGRSTAGWNVQGTGAKLARIYFDGSSVAQATGYYDPGPEGTGVIRLRRFPNPVTASQTYSVGLEILTPDETPAHAPTSGASRNVVINRINPDLQLQSVTPATDTVPRGSAVSVTIARQNAVSTEFAAVEPNLGRIYLSSNTTLEVGTDTEVATFTQSAALAPGGSESQVVSVTVPAGQSPGPYYLIARGDADSTVLETSETNNDRASAGTLLVTAPCTWSSSVWIILPLSTTETLTGSGDCSGRTATITGTAGFAGGTACELKTAGNGRKQFFTVRGCGVGNSTMNIYRDAAKTDHEATVTIRAHQVDPR